MDQFSAGRDPQRKSSKLSAVDMQLDLLPKKRSAVPADKNYVINLPSIRRAIRYSVSISDLEPKQVYEPLEMDKATWSRIANGDMSFPADHLERLANVTENEAPLIWWAHRRGFDLRPHKSELQEQLDAALAREADLEQRLETITEFFRRTQAGR